MEPSLDHLAIIVKLAKMSEPRPLGRTALMKYLYFLKSIRNLPLGYEFKLYTYGPFDAAVLDDLKYAEALGAVTEEMVTYSGGYGYEIRPASKADTLMRRSSKWLQRIDDDLAWVLGKFGQKGAAQLEMASTLVFVDRDGRMKKEPLEFRRLVETVHGVKPHLSKEQIKAEAIELKSMGLLG
jgi:uncharacterized protein